MTDFAHGRSVVRRIWADGDMVLLIFAGSAAEFALNRAVDWLFFTGKLPADPIGRFFVTTSYAQRIVFADEATAQRTLDGIRAAHEAVERRRGQTIPEWAHRDVLYMLIDYSERAHELLARPLTAEERDDLYDVFYRVGRGLGIRDLPPTYAQWKRDRERHLRADLAKSEGTEALYATYRREIGAWRYRLLLWIQAALVPAFVRDLIGLKPAAWFKPILRLYPILARAGLRSMIQRVLMPSEHLAGVRELYRKGSAKRIEAAPPSAGRFSAPPSPGGLYTSRTQPKTAANGPGALTHAVRAE